MYVQNNGENNAMRLTFATVSDERYTLDSSLIPDVDTQASSERGDAQAGNSEITQYIS